MGNGNLIAVADAGPFIHLAEVNCPSFLNVFTRLHVPETVWSEIIRQPPVVAWTQSDEQIALVSAWRTRHTRTRPPRHSRRFQIESSVNSISYVLGTRRGQGAHTRTRTK